MKKFLLTLFICSSFSFSGCELFKSALNVASHPVQSASNATVTVESAEKTLRITKDTLDVFVHLEYQNRDFVKSKFPSIHLFAESVRRTAPDLLISGNKLKNVYKHNRTPENAASLNTILVTLKTLASEAKTNTLTLNSATP